jgi:hypothetical protein
MPLIRDAFDPEQALSWYGWEQLPEDYRPGAYGEDPVWNNHGGIYSGKLAGKYPSPLVFYAPQLRPVFVGKPVC